MTTFQPVERASADDLMSLAAERGSTPMQVGAVLMLDVRQGLDPDSAMDAIAHRSTTIPRLRQRLVTVPWGCGRPVWVDDPDLTATRHLSTVRCPGPDGEAAVLDVAAEMLVTRLPRDRPLWAAKLVTDVAEGEAALIIVFHHVLADGIGGLAVLSKLVDGAPGAAGANQTAGAAGANQATGAARAAGAAGADQATGAASFTSPRPMPSRSQLAVDAAQSRARGLRHPRTMIRRLRIAASQLRPAAGMRLARSSLNMPTGPRRTFATVRVKLEQVRNTAHAHHATVNDVVLSATAAALHRLLSTRNEQLDQFVISVPFSSRAEASANDLGNQSAVIPLCISGTGDPVQRLESVARTTRAAKQTQAGASNALLGPLFRLLARAGLYGWFIGHQRLIHTFVTNLHGPETALSFLGCPITGIIPLSVATGNVTISFAVMSYANSLTVTLIADPQTCPDLPVLRDALKDELTRSLPR